MTRLPIHSAGFSLLELMTTVSVAAILLAVGVPTFTDIIRNNRLTSAANDLQHSTQLARAEAVKRQVPVVVCASGNATAEPPSCNDGRFSQWVVFVDTDGDWALDAGEMVLERHETLDPSVTVLNEPNGIISYAASGFAQPGVAGGKQPTRNVIFCDRRGNQDIGNVSTARALLIGVTGRTRTTKNPAEIGDAMGDANVGGCPE